MLLDSFWHLCTGDRPFLVDYLLGVIVARYEVHYIYRLWNGSWFVQCVTGFCWRSNFKKCIGNACQKYANKVGLS